ncbi:MAG: sulfur oxidation c-type cytochrome SoxX, partial [Caldimonas sp.]
MTSTFRWIAGGAAVLVIAAVAAGCAMTPQADYDKVALEMIKGSFRPQGQAGIDRLQQDEAQRICSGPAAPSPADLKRIETAELATVKPPPSGRYIGDWREGEKLAQ